MFSTTGIQPSSLAPGSWPLRIIIIGSPLLPPPDQLFFILLGVFEVLPNLIELPNLPSNILSPAKGNIG